jgi:flagellar biosynthesis protein FlhA
MMEGLRPGDGGPQILMDTRRLEALITSLKSVLQGADNGNDNLVLVCAPALRSAVRRLIGPHAPDVPVLSYLEVTAAHPAIETVGVIRALDPIPA